MADNRYQIVYRNGIALDRWTAQLWDKLKAKFPNLILTQGVNSGAAASAGTHRGLGVLDLYLGGHDWRAVLHYWFDIGGFGWYRPTLPGVWKAHCHLGVRGNAKMATSLKAQQVSWANGRNGLAGNGDDFYDYRPANYKQPAPYGKPTTITAMQFNLPAPGVGIGGDLGNDTKRIKAAVKLVKKGNPHFVTWNELGPVKRVGTPSVASAFASSTDTALGDKFGLVRPTKAYNENYISYRSDRLKVVKQYDDSILESVSGGRHLTRVVFEHANGLVFAVGAMHLVPGSTATAKRSQQAQAADALASIQAVSAKHGNCPYFLAGDINNPLDLTALTKAGMKRTRKWADKSDGAKATFTNYAKAVPSTNSRDWEIDQQYASRDWYVVTYKVLRTLRLGKYVKPRASDHDPIVSSMSADA